MTCTITESGTWTWTYSGSLSVTATIAKVLAIGASGGFSNAAANMLLASDSVTLKENECGYFTFLPLLEETCGVATLGEPTENSTTKGCGYDITEDHCVTRSSYVPDGKSIKGATIFVKIDCSNNQRLPMDQQNPAYNHEGVPAPQSVYDVWIADLPAAATPPAAENPQTTPPPIGPLEDCSLVAYVFASSSLLPSPQTTANTDSQNHK
ncbi:MAG: hypothetical protein L6R40_005010 [Gallowayella cf. fulva]|nr:MAG: hypothetical protein L6R40_005010 [Xanthomendoza cf. fulva]